MSIPRCCILVPTYNNGGTVATVLRAILASGERDVIVVNDGSTDNTVDVLRNIDGVQVLTNDRNRGKGLSLRRGFDAALEQGFDYAITIDSDGQHAPAEIAKMRAAIAATVSYTHLRSPRDRTRSRMPSSA